MNKRIEFLKKAIELFNYLESERDIHKLSVKSKDTHNDSLFLSYNTVALGADGNYSSVLNCHLTLVIHHIIFAEYEQYVKTPTAYAEEKKHYPSTDQHYEALIMLIDQCIHYEDKYDKTEFSKKKINKKVYKANINKKIEDGYCVLSMGYPGHRTMGVLEKKGEDYIVDFYNTGDGLNETVELLNKIKGYENLKCTKSSAPVALKVKVGKEQFSDFIEVLANSLVSDRNYFVKTFLPSLISENTVLNVINSEQQTHGDCGLQSVKALISNQIAERVLSFTEPDDIKQANVYWLTKIDETVKKLNIDYNKFKDQEDSDSFLDLIKESTQQKMLTLSSKEDRDKLSLVTGKEDELNKSLNVTLDIKNLKRYCPVHDFVSFAAWLSIPKNKKQIIDGTYSLPGVGDVLYYFAKENSAYFMGLHWLGVIDKFWLILYNKCNTITNNKEKSVYSVFKEIYPSEWKVLKEDMLTLQLILNTKKLEIFVANATKGETILITSDIESCLLNGTGELVLDKNMGSLTTWNAELLLLFKDIKEKAKAKGIGFKFSICSTAGLLQQVYLNSKNKELIFKHLFELNDSSPILQLVATNPPNFLIFEKDVENKIKCTSKNILDIVETLKKLIPKNSSGYRLVTLVSLVKDRRGVNKSVAIILEALYRKYILKEFESLKIIFFDNDKDHIDSVVQLYDKFNKFFVDENIAIKTVLIEPAKSPLATKFFEDTSGGDKSRKVLVGFTSAKYSVKQVYDLYIQLGKDFAIKESDRQVYMDGLFSNEELKIVKKSQEKLKKYSILLEVDSIKESNNQIKEVFHALSEELGKIKDTILIDNNKTGQHLRADNQALAIIQKGIGIVQVNRNQTGDDKVTLRSNFFNLVRSGLDALMNVQNQEDASEFLNRVIESAFWNNPVIEKSTLKWNAQNLESNLDMPSSIMQIPISKEQNFSAMISNYQKPETVEDVEYESGKKATALKTISLHIPADRTELVMSVVRFTFENGLTTKNDADIIFNKLTFNARDYWVTAFVQHIGDGTKQGHYVTYIKEASNNNDDCWFCYNDDVRKEIDLEEVQEALKKAYVVKYTTTEAQLPAAQTGTTNLSNNCWLNASLAFINSLTSIKKHSTTITNSIPDHIKIDSIPQGIMIKEDDKKEILPTQKITPSSSGGEGDDGLIDDHMV
jgi:hypothetical protein